MALPAAMKGKAAKKVAAAMKAKSAMKAAGAKNAAGAMKKAAPMKKVIKKPTRASGVLAKALVLRGAREKTMGGLSKSDLQKNLRGKVVSKKASSKAKKAFKGSALEKFALACKEARTQLGLKGFVPIGGKTAEGQRLLAKIRAIVAGKA